MWLRIIVIWWGIWLSLGLVFGLANGQEIEGDKENLPFLVAAIEGVASGFEQGKLKATVEHLGNKANVDLTWKGDNARWIVRGSSRPPEGEHKPELSLETNVDIVLSDRHLVSYYPEEALVKCRPRRGKKMQVNYLNLVPSEFWKSGHPNLPTIARSISPEVLTATTGKVIIKREASTIEVTKLFKGGGSSTLTFEGEEAMRFVGLNQTPVPPGTIRHRAALRWASLEDGAIYLAESKYWSSIGAAPFPSTPDFVYICESITNEIPKDLTLDYDAGRFSEGTKIEECDANGSVIREEFRGGKSKYEELLLRKAAERNRKSGVSAGT